MKKTAICIIFCMSIISIHAQTNYEEGYIITNNQDTVHGLIDYRTDYMNGKICRFKTDSLSKEQVYYPDDIAGFRYLYSGKFYVSKTINIENIPRTVFLEYLIKGIINLYFYKDADFNMIGYYIFEDEDGKLHNISKHADKYVTKKSGELVLKKDAKYRTDLNFVFGDIEQIASKLQNANFDHKTMIGFTKNYHKLKCTTGEECITFETKDSKKNVIFKYLIYSGYECFTYTNFISEKKAVDALIIGSRIEFISPRWNKSVSALLDLSYSASVGSYSFSKFEIDFGGKYTYQQGGGLTAEAGMSLLMEKNPDIAAFRYCLFVGGGIEMDLGNKKFMSILAEYIPNFSDSTMSLSDIWRIKFGFKF